MSGYIKYFDDGRKNISFKIEYESLFLKYNEIWNKVKKTLHIKFHSQPIYDEKFIKTKVKTFNNVINTVFLDKEIPKKRSLCTCIVAINIDSVMKIDKKNYPQVYLEQFNYKIKKRKLVDFIDAEVDLDSDHFDDSNSE